MCLLRAYVTDARTPEKCNIDATETLTGETLSAL